MSQTSVESIELELALLVRRIISLSSKRNTGSLDRSAYLLLHCIATNGAAGVKQLAEELHLDISTVSRQAAALEQKGYVFKVPDPLDRRSYDLQKTEAGTQALVEFKKQRLAQMHELLKDWPEEDLARFGDLLTKFNHAFSELTDLST